MSLFMVCSGKVSSKTERNLITLQIWLYLTDFVQFMEVANGHTWNSMV
jgi:hypothetical protein